MSDSLSHTQLKKRLLGAGILVLIAAMFVSLFESEPKQSLEQGKTEENSGFQSRIQPLEMPAETLVEDQLTPLEVDDSGMVLKKLAPLQPVDREVASTAEQPVKPVDIQPLRRDGSTAPLPGKTAKTPVAKTPPKKVAPKPASKKVTKKPAKKQVAPKKVASAPKKTSSQKPGSIRSGWAVQAGVFSKPANADSIAKILRSKGHRPQVTNTKTSTGRAKRVWLGPYATKAEARAVSKRLEQQTGNGGYVAPYPFKS